MQIDALIEDVVAIKRQGTIPLRQIRASYDERTITVYQAYPASIAIPAVKLQKIHASPGFLFSRMTWIKPSWCWMMFVATHSSTPCLTFAGIAQAILPKTRGNPIF